MASATPRSPSDVAVDAAQHLVERRLAGCNLEQSAVEDRSHTTGDRGLFDRVVVGARKDQTIDIAARRQQLTDRQPAAIAGTAAFRAADRAIGNHRAISRRQYRREP